MRVALRIGDEDQSETEIVEARCVINAAGLYADEIASLLGPRPWTIYPVRGEYCEIRGPHARTDPESRLSLAACGRAQPRLALHQNLLGHTFLGPTANYVDGKDNYERDRMTIPEFAD